MVILLNGLGFVSRALHMHPDYFTDKPIERLLVTGIEAKHINDDALGRGLDKEICENQVGLPVYMQACSGNTQDSENFKSLVKAHLGSLKAATRCRYLIGDAALYMAETIKAFDSQKQLFTSRVLQTLTEAKKLIAQHYTAEFIILANGYSAAWFNVDYGDVPQCWLLVRSEQAKHRANHTLHKIMLAKSTAQAAKAFACEADTKQALGKWQATQPGVKVAESGVLSRISYARCGRPKADAPAKTHISLVVSFIPAWTINKCKQLRKVYLS